VPVPKDIAAFVESQTYMAEYQSLV
jgi:hypothetical protein